MAKKAKREKASKNPEKEEYKVIEYNEHTHEMKVLIPKPMVTREEYVLLKANKASLDTSQGGYGFVKADAVVEVHRTRAKSLVERGIFSYVDIPEETNYFFEVK